MNCTQHLFGASIMDTSSLVAMKAIVRGFFGSFFLGNFQLGFLLGGFGV